MKRFAAVFAAILILSTMLLVEVSANSPAAMENGGFQQRGEWFFYLVSSLLGLIFTVVIERGVAWLFGIEDEKTHSVIWVNVVSQVLMRVGFALVYPKWISSYAAAVAIFEVLVYSGEFLAYGKLWKDVSVKKRLAFVCAANTASLVLGLWVNRFLQA